MKKLFLFILTMMYMTMVSGVGIDVHYCMGKKSGVDLYGPTPEGKCGKCGMKEKPTGCCQSQHKFFKLNDSHKNVNNNLSLAGSGLSVINFGSLFKPKPPVRITSVEAEEYSPPYEPGPSPIILHCTFRK